jgi:type IV secretion system protein VirD4
MNAGDEKKVERARWYVSGAVVLGLAVLVLLIRYPLIAVLGAAVLISWSSARRSGRPVPFAAALPVLCAALTGFVFSALASGAAKVFAAGPSAAGPAVWQSWLTLQPLSAWANAAGRVGMLAGAAVGTYLAVFGLRGGAALHGPGVVRGRPGEGWAKDADVADKCEFGPPRDGWGLIPLGKLQGRIVRVAPEKGRVKMGPHVLVVGATGTGKSYTSIRNFMIAAAADGHSIVVADPKGELLEDMARWLRDRKGYRVLVFNVADPRYGHRWNPLQECRDFEEMQDLAEWMISAAGDDHAFFSGGEKNILAAAVAYARWALPERQRHLRAALSLLSWPQEVLDAAYTEAYQAGKVPQGAYETWRAAQGHYSNYIEGVRNKLRVVTKGSLAALTSESDFALESLGQERTALFLIMPDKGDLQGLYVPFFKFMFERLTELADGSPGKRLPVPVRFILDEFYAIGRIPDIEKVAVIGRSRGMWLHIAIQNIGQLKGLYARGKVWEALAGNCPVKLCLSTDDLATAQYFVSLMGKGEQWYAPERRVVESAAGPFPLPVRPDRPEKKVETLRQVTLMDPHHLLQLPEEDCVAVLRGKPPLYLKKLAWTDLPQHREIVRAGKAAPSDFVPGRALDVELPPFPEGTNDTGEERNRGRKRGAEKAEEIDLLEELGL